MIYLNHAGTSFPKPQSVHEAVAATLSAPPEQHAAIYDRAFSTVKREFRAAGKGDPFRTQMTSGCTAALALALGDVPWASGDFLLTSGLEHHALDRVAQSLELARDIVRVAVPPSQSSPIDLAALERHLVEKQVRLVALTQASNITGEPMPLEEISRLAHQNGAHLLVDAAQTFGTSLFDEAVRWADIIVCAGHKSALGPQGVGVLAARASFSFLVPGAACELGEKACGSFPGFCDVGSVNLAGLAGLAEGLRWSHSQGRARLLQESQRLASRLRSSLADSDGFELLGDSENEGLATISFVPRRGELSELGAHFHKRGLWLRVGTHCAPQALATLGHPAGCARISFGPLSRESDVLAVEHALREFLA